MKTPEEIKCGLKQCYTIGMWCNGCPYEKYEECYDILALDANTYIEQLEKHISLNTLRDAIYEDAVAHGLWDLDYSPTDCAELIHDEASELYSAAMDWEYHVCNDNSAFCDELADVIIASLSVAGKLGIDIDAAVRRKMEINKSRPWKHGKDEKK